MFWRRRQHTLLVMRLDDMHVVHPEMDSSQVCARCRQPVGIYPSGQGALQRYGKDRMEIVCSRCQAPDASARPAPGALAECDQSIPKVQ